MPQKGQVSKAKAWVDRHVGRPPRDDGMRAASFGVGVCAACFGDGMRHVTSIFKGKTSIIEICLRL